MFSEREIEAIKKNFKLTGVADLFGVSPRYVSLILHNEREVNTDTANNIYKLLKRRAKDFDENFQFEAENPKQ